MPGQTEVKESRKIAPFMVMFLIHPVQFGLGVGGGQDKLAMTSGHNGWIGVIFAGLWTGLLIWVMYSILNRGKGSILTVHNDIFGKWVGNVFNHFVIAFFLAKALAGLVAYILIVQVWMFKGLETWVIALLFYVIAFYTITGGFRVVTGLCLMCFAVPFVGILPFLSIPLTEGDFQNLVPIFNGSLPDMAKATFASALPYLGASSLLMAYPFIQNPRSSQKWAHISNLFTTVLLLSITIIVYAYFSLDLLKKMIWPNLSMMRSVELPLMNEFETLFIFLYMMVIVPNIVFSIWAASRGMKEMYGMQQRHMLVGILVFLFILTLFFDNQAMVNKFMKILNTGGVMFLYLYLPLLLMIQTIKMKMGSLEKMNSQF